MDWVAAEDAVLERLLAEAASATGRVVAYGEEPDQVVELYGEGGSRCVVVVHGGYFRPSIDRTHARPMARALAAKGRTVALVEYRRVPGDPAATVADLRAAEGWLRAQGLDPEVWVGHSAGGTLVLLRALAEDLPSVRVVALAPLADLAGAVRDELGSGAVAEWVGKSERVGERALSAVDPVVLLAERDDAQEVRDRVRVLHGDRDATVPVAQSLAWSDNAVSLAGAHHFDLIDPASPHWRWVLDALD